MDNTSLIQTKKYAELTDIFIAIAVGFVLFIVYINSHYLQNGDIIPNEDLPISIIREGNLELHEFVKPPVSDFEKGVAKNNDGIGHYWMRISPNRRIVSLFPIVPGIMNVPAYLIANWMDMDIVKNKHFLSHITASLSVALSGVFLYLLLQFLFADRKTSILFTMAYGLGTCVWSIASTGIWQHGPSVLFINIALFLFFHPDKRISALSGMFFAFSVVNRPTNAFLMAGFCLYVLLYKREIMLMFIGWALIPFALMGWYFQEYWGSVFGQFQSAATAAPPSVSFSNLVQKVPTRLFSPSIGLIAMSPFLFFGMMQMPKILFAKGRENIIWKICVISVIVFFVFYCSVNMEGSYSFGYRYMIEIVPFLVIFSAWYYKESPLLQKFNFQAASLWFFLVFSIFVQTVGAFSKHCNFNSTPKNIVYAPERLWLFVDSRVSRCLKQEIKGRAPVKAPASQSTKS